MVWRILIRVTSWVVVEPVPIYRAHADFSPHCTPRARRAGVAPPRRWDRYASSARLVPTRAGRTLLSEEPACARHILASTRACRKTDKKTLKNDSVFGMMRLVQCFLVVFRLLLLSA
jgi:hypothetical protein